MVLQVYRGRLRSTDREVAVKVQRPLVRESIALDIHILRILAAFVRRWRRLNSDLPALLDEVIGRLQLHVHDPAYCMKNSNGIGACSGLSSNPLGFHFTVALYCGSQCSSSLQEVFLCLSMHVAVMQWAESLFRELDYRKEAANGIRFKELYGDLEVRCSFVAWFPLPVQLRLLIAI